MSDRIGLRTDITPPTGAAVPTSAGRHTVGTADGFQRLFLEQFGAMAALARLLGADDPENAAQEAFLKLYMQRSHVDDPLAYLRRTVVNLSSNSLRHRWVRFRNTPRSADSTASAESSALARQDVAAALTAIERLPRRRREALVLRHWLGLSYQDIGATLGVSAVGARSLTHRALAKLHRALDLPEEQS